MNKIKLLMSSLLITIILYGCATKSEEIQPTPKDIVALPKYTISLPFSSDNIGKTKFYPIKEVLNSINYTYSNGNEFLDSNVAVLLPRQQNANLLLVKLDEDNVTVVVLLSLGDNGKENVYPVFTEVHNPSALISSVGKVDSVAMTTVIDESYNIVINSRLTMNGENITEIVKYFINANGELISKEDKPSVSTPE